MLDTVGSCLEYIPISLLAEPLVPGTSDTQRGLSVYTDPRDGLPWPPANSAPLQAAGPASEASWQSRESRCCLTPSAWPLSEAMGSLPPHLALQRCQTQSCKEGDRRADQSRFGGLPPSSTAHFLVPGHPLTAFLWALACCPHTRGAERTKCK